MYQVAHTDHNDIWSIFNCQINPQSRINYVRDFNVKVCEFKKRKEKETFCDEIKN